MAYLEELIPQLRYRRNDYLMLLKNLLPQGTFWRIPLPIEPVLRVVGISSAESIGDCLVSASGILVAPDSIASIEAFGSPDIGRQYLVPSSISSEESFGTPSVT